MLKLDLGAGNISPDGFVPLGRAHGSEIYPLPSIPDASCDVVRCSHALEHFPHQQVPLVLKEWVRCLKPGGELQIAVPDFAKIATAYIAGARVPIESYAMGGQTDADDFHKALFDQDHLTKLLAQAGLVLIRSWKSELDDCANLPVSLNLKGSKPHQAELSFSAVFSLPRITWTDNAFCIPEALTPLKIKVRRFVGAYWEQCLERCIEQAIREDDADIILTLDYDTVFSRKDVSTMMALMMCHPEVDALAAIQSARGRDGPLFTMQDESGRMLSQIPTSVFAGDLTPAATAHFGLTMLRTEKFKNVSKPWLHSIPAPDGSWNEGRQDADVAFWHKWKAAGNSLFIANRVSVGHLELMIRWPGEDLRAIHQETSEWRNSGPPKGLWT